jgi:hypothetical protein
MTRETRAEDRIRNAALRDRICTAELAAARIHSGYRVGMTGLPDPATPSWCPRPWLRTSSGSTALAGASASP